MVLNNFRNMRSLKLGPRVEMGGQLALLILFATLLLVVRVDGSRKLHKTARMDFPAFLIPEVTINIELLKHKTLFKMLKGNKKLRSSSCHKTVIDVLIKRADKFLTKMRDCPKTPEGRFDFVIIQKSATEIKRKLSENHENLQRNVEKYHEANKLVIDITQNILFLNATIADTCKLPSARGLLGSALTFVSDIMYCSFMNNVFPSANVELK